MKVLHTADWHIGQLFYEYDRSYEHEQFLNWLTECIYHENIDLLLISGDIFDIANPGAYSIRLFYQFLNNTTRKCPSLQVIITAGNHDSASRLEAPRPLLESSRIHIVGTIEKNAEGQINYEKICVPLLGTEGSLLGWCLAVPYLRAGDYPNLSVESGQSARGQSYAEGVAAFYKEAYQYLLENKQTKGKFLIALGHLHAAKAEITDMDSSERAIMGGIESVGAEAFPDSMAYVALGHIHKAQKIGGKEHIRYSGSPIPLSFSELNYKHQVICFELKENLASVNEINAIEVPVSVPLLSIPSKPAPLPEVLKELATLPDLDQKSKNAYPPFLQVNILLDEPRPGLRHQVEKALEQKKVRLAKIDVKYPSKQNQTQEDKDLSMVDLGELNPVDIFTKVYEQRFNAPPPAHLTDLFNQVTTEIGQNQA